MSTIKIEETSRGIICDVTICKVKIIASFKSYYNYLKGLGSYTDQLNFRYRTTKCSHCEIEIIGQMCYSSYVQGRHWFCSDKCVKKHFAMNVKAYIIQSYYRGNMNIYSPKIVRRLNIGVHSLR